MTARKLASSVPFALGLLLAALGCSSDGGAAPADSGQALGGAGAGGAGGGGAGGSSGAGGGSGAGGSGVTDAGAGMGGAAGAADAGADLGPTGAGGSGCFSVSDPARTVRKLSANSAAALAGDALVGVSGDVPGLRRMITARITSELPALRFAEATVTRASTQEETALLTVRAENTGTEYLCFMRGEMYAWRAADGRALLAADGSNLNYTYVFGAVGEVEPGVFVPACLGPGDIGYIRDIKRANAAGQMFSVVDAIEMIVRDSGITGKPAPGALVPTNYQACSTPSFQVMLANDSAVPVMIEGPSVAWVAFLDQQDRPLGWVFVDTAPGVVAPGARLTSDPESLYPLSGRAAGIHAFAKYDPPGVMPMSQAMAVRVREHQAVSRALLDGWRRSRVRAGERRRR